MHSRDNGSFTVFFSIMAVAAIFGMVASSFSYTYTPAAFAQEEGQCETPNFELLSNTSLSAITDREFNYLVVSNTNLSMSLASSLPAGLSYMPSNQLLSGTFASAGEYTVRFRVTNDCGNSATQSISIAVYESQAAQTQAQDTTADTGDDAATDDTGPASEDDYQYNDEAAGSQSADKGGTTDGSVGLNEIPETSFDADQMLTMMFYLLALMSVAGVAVSQMTSSSTPQAAYLALEPPTRDRSADNYTQNGSAPTSHSANDHSVHQSIPDDPIAKRQRIDGIYRG